MPLAEIVKAPGWQPYTVRGFINSWQEGRGEDRVIQERGLEAHVQDQVLHAIASLKRRFGSAAGGVSCPHCSYPSRH